MLKSFLTPEHHTHPYVNLPQIGALQLETQQLHKLSLYALALQFRFTENMASS